MHCEMLKIQDGVAIVEKLNSGIFPRDCLHLKINTTYFDLILCILEFRFCIFVGQSFLN